MANIVYGWNPFQERTDCRISNEIVKTSAQKTRKEFVPRAAPFYSRNFKLFRQGDPDPLVPGTDYAFAHMFDGFVMKYSRNVFGSVVLLNDKYKDDVLIVSYDTIGGPFTLNDAAFVELVANIINSPRQADWADLDDTTIPVEFPPDPHQQPAAQTYDYLEMMVALRSYIAALVQSQQEVDLGKLLQEHLDAPLAEAHEASKDDFGLNLVQNMGPATSEDLNGNSDNKLMTVARFKEGLRRLSAGDLNIN